MATTKRSDSLTLWDRLSRLNFEQASKLLGPNAKKLIMRGAGAWELNVSEHACLSESQFRLKFPVDSDEDSPIVTIRLRDDVRQRLHSRCSHCDDPCLHVGAAFSVLL